MEILKVDVTYIRKEFIIMRFNNEIDFIKNMRVKKKSIINRILISTIIIIDSTSNNSNNLLVLK